MIIVNIVQNIQNIKYVYACQDYLNISRAQILKHIKMTAGLKVWVQGFQISLRIFSILNENVDHFILF
jgi:hypothetical protein